MISPYRKSKSTFANWSLFLFVLTSIGFGQSSIIALVFKVILLFAVINEYAKRGSRSGYTKNPFYKWSFCVMLIFWASLYWAVNGMLGLPTVITVTLNTLYCCFTFYLINGSVYSLSQSISCFVAGSVIFFFYIFITNGGVLEIGERMGGASALTMGHLAAISSMFVFYNIFQAHNKQVKNILLFVILLCIIIISGTRKALILSFISIGIYQFCKMRGKKKVWVMLSVFIMLTIGFYLIMNIPILYDMIGVRIYTMIAGFEGGDKSVSDSSTLTRLAFIEFGVEGIKERPLFGYGPDSFIYMYGKAHLGEWIAYSHNNFIEICYSIGLIGLIIYYSIYYFILKRLWLNYKVSKDTTNLLFFSLLIGLIIIHYGWVAYFSLPNNLILVFAACVAYRKHIT